ncbi:(d)CMP kinase [bacterium]|nr:(d)CMP kinase [bacterium]
MIRKKKPILAIDGPAGAGKSTVAKLLAQTLGYLYIDTGAMYRAITLKSMRAGVDLTDQAAVEAIARQARLSFVPGEVGTIIMDGQDVSQAIRTPEVTRNVSAYVASYSGVRKVMVAGQRQMGAQGGVVMEGRDITSVVFPDAGIKVYLDADLEERAQRRFDELKGQGQEQPFEELLADLKQRDVEDLHRPGGALQCVADALVVNSTGLTIEQVVAAIVKAVREKEVSCQ